MRTKRKQQTMAQTRQRIIFLCANHSIRAHMAASLLAARVRAPWDVWCTPVIDAPQQHDFAQRVLDEIGIPLLSSPQTSEPAFGHTFDEGVILCSGEAAT
jgi:protein-tyrosine-phosphatase